MNERLAFWIFVPLAAALYWRFKKTSARAWFLFVVSAGFLATLDAKAVVELLFLSLFCYAGVHHPRLRGRRTTVLLVVGVLGFLGFYKYLPRIVHLFEGHGAPTLAHVLVPLGASYFTFKLIHYVVEASRGRLPPHSLGAYLGWVFFFPMFTAGPIERFEDYQAHQAPAFTREHLLGAVTRIAYGLIKKFVLIDLLDRHYLHDPHHLADAIPILVPSYPAEALITLLPTLHPAYAWQFVVNHFVGAYLDFSAYNDIAIGSALLFGIKLTENFDYPILATNIGEFWKRWHISLSNWCQRYVYMPTMALTRRPYLAIYATMIVMSMWHEGSLGFFYRGLYHGTLIAIFVTWGRVRRKMKWKASSAPLAVGSARLLTFASAAAAGAFTATGRSGATGLRLFAALFGVHVQH